jgi:DNA-binding CsgD family transcriptional regulator
MNNLHGDELGEYIQKNIRPSSINTHAVTVVDLKSNHYRYVDPRIQQVTGYTQSIHENRGPRFMFSKIPISHKIGVIKSTLHQNKFISNFSPAEIKDLIINREINIKDPKGNSRRILHQVLDHIDDETGKISAVISLQTQIGHISSASKFKYYIYSKSKNCIIYPSEKKSSKDRYTAREKEIILLVSQGLSSSQIADKLFLSLHTVKTHRKNILQKSNASNFFELLHSLDKGH